MNNVPIRLFLRDGSDYYCASVPEYDRLEIRRADSLEGLRRRPLSSGANRKADPR